MGAGTNPFKSPSTLGVKTIPTPGATPTAAPAMPAATPKSLMGLMASKGGANPLQPAGLSSFGSGLNPFASPKPNSTSGPEEPPVGTFNPTDQGGGGPVGGGQSIPSKGGVPTVPGVPTPGSFDPMDLLTGRSGSGGINPLAGGPGSNLNLPGPKTPQGLPIPPIGFQGGANLFGPGRSPYGQSPNVITPNIDVGLGKAPPIIAGLDHAATPNGPGDMGPTPTQILHDNIGITGEWQPPKTETFHGFDNIPMGTQDITPPPDPFKPPVVEPNGPASNSTSDLNSLLAGKYKDLLNGNDPAQAQAERVALNSLGGQQKDATSAAAARAAQMGLAPGTPGYNQIMDEAQRGVTSAGSGLLSNLAQKGLDAQTANMSAAGNFQSRRDVIGQTQTQNQVSAAQHIVDNPDLYKPDEVSIAKDIVAGKGLGVQTGADSSWKNARPADTDPQASIKSLEQILSQYPENAGKSPADITALAKERYKTMSETEWQAFLDSGKVDVNKAPATDTSGSGSNNLYDNYLNFSSKTNPVPKWADPMTWF